MQTLRDIIADLDDAPEDGVILAMEPWTPDSPARIDFFDLGQIVDQTGAGMTYFIEVMYAQEFREGVSELTGDALCLRVIQYAINDA